jgi:hypothetical protein
MTWDESQHPRDPKGQSTGGRFTKGREMSYLHDAVGKYKRVWAGQKMNEEENGELPEKLSAPFYNSNTQVLNVFGSAMEVTASGELETAILVSSDGEAKAFFTGGTGLPWQGYVNQDVDISFLGDNAYLLEYLGAADNAPGWGVVAFVEAAQEAIDDFDATGLVLQSLDRDSDRFYRSLGMVDLGLTMGTLPDPMRVFGMDGNTLNKILEAYYGN